MNEAGWRAHEIARLERKIEELREEFLQFKEHVKLLEEKFDVQQKRRSSNS